MARVTHDILSSKLDGAVVRPWRVTTVDGTMLPPLIRCSSSGVYLRRLFSQTPVNLEQVLVRCIPNILTQSC